MTTTKIAKLNDLTDPEKIDTFERDILNLARTVPVHSLEEVTTTKVILEDVAAATSQSSSPVAAALAAAGSAEKTTTTKYTNQKTVDRGRLNLLLKYRVYPAKGGPPRIGTETIEAGANHGGDWSAELTSEAEESLWATIFPYLGAQLGKRLSKLYDKPGETPDATGMMRHIIKAKRASDARTAKRDAEGD